ncbi:MAG TPA: adenylate/guanylate cyclase domain-containing protein [Kiloniellales bacterium]|nr:adenylate/guanylate cyclase domain-containing protein [Kiloniellales bacterium]
MERRLAAILAADVVGYSRLMRRDEADTFARLRAHRKELFEPTIAGHHGRIFKLMGDGLMVEFASVVDAVNCAMALQKAMAERNGDVPRDKRIDMRIGVTLGDVIVEGEDCHGDGVNMAARLQALAEPGGICVSALVADQLRNKSPVQLEALGEVKVKNIAEPVTVHRVLLEGATPRSPILLWLGRMRRQQRFALRLGLIVVLAGGGVAAWQLQRAHAPKEFPTVAVLPFDNLSADPQMDYFSDGVSEDIITMLSRFPDLAVVARNSSFVYKGSSTDIRQVGRELGANYVLEGSVRKRNDKIRLTAQLIDAESGDHVWAERYDEEGTDPWQLQDKVIGKIIDSLTGERGEVRQAEYRRAWGTDSTNLEEYDYYLRGHELFMNAKTKETLDEAGAIWAEGLSEFPNSSLLRVKLAFYHLKLVWRWWSDDVPGEVRQAEAVLQEALSTPNLSPQVRRLGHWAMAWTRQMQGDLAAAATEAKAAIALARYDAFMVADLASILAMAGEPSDAVVLLEEVRSRNPNFNQFWELSVAYYLVGDDEQAVEAALQIRPNSLDRYVLLASSRVRLGRLDEARAAVKKLLELNPQFTQQTLKDNYIYSDPTILERQAADLGKVGLPVK